MPESGTAEEIKNKTSQNFRPQVALRSEIKLQMESSFFFRLFLVIRASNIDIEMVHDCYK